MLSKISGVTAALAAILNAVVLLGWWDLTADQVAGINAAIVAVGFVVHSYFNPSIPLGKT
jgi:hypothetical protein